MDVIIREADERTGTPEIILRLPDQKLTAARREQMYIQAVESLHIKADTYRRALLRDGRYLDYLECDKIEHKERERLFKQFFADCE